MKEVVSVRYDLSKLEQIEEGQRADFFTKAFRKIVKPHVAIYSVMTIADLKKVYEKINRQYEGVYKKFKNACEASKKSAKTDRVKNRKDVNEATTLRRNLKGLYRFQQLIERLNEYGVFIKDVTIGHEFATIHLQNRTVEFNHIKGHVVLTQMKRSCLDRHMI